MSKSPHEQDKDKAHSLNVTGRFQQIPTKPGKDVKRPTLAAGAVLWKGDVTDPRVAVIHRPCYDDWSLAKGKLDPGESLPVTAIREIFEETGYTVRLGKLLGRVSYPVLDRTKIVYYWTAKVLGGHFTPNDEVDEIRWLTLDEAKELLTYEVDTHVLEKANKRFHLPAESRVLLVRHAKAHDKRKWAGDDNLRPLEKKGLRQAEMLVPLLLGFRPERVYSAVPDRCQSTAAPIAEEVGVSVHADPLLGDDAQPDEAIARFDEIIAEGGVSVVVSQGERIPALLQHYSDTGRLPLPMDEVKCKKGSVWVLSFNGGQLTGADYLASALPVK
ncbi:MAG: NUDIX hydrolase [Corynebacterium glucuronolyticum]|nr:NUDIX hydrolase [Corynebacterium glucuronolyticum]